MIEYGKDSEDDLAKKPNPVQKQVDKILAAIEIENQGYEKKIRREAKEELDKWLAKNEIEKQEMAEHCEKFQKELDAKYDPIDLRIKESILVNRDYTGFYFYPAVLLGIYLGWKIGFMFCDALLKAYYP